MYSPMLAELGSQDDLKRSHFIFEPKFDGTRVLIYKQKEEIKLINRRGLNISYRYPELKVAGNIEADQAVLDGELVVFDRTGKPNFYLLAEREHIESRLKIRLRAKLFPATLIVFDVLELNGKPLVRKPLLERKRILERLVKESERIRLCPWTKEGRKLWREVRKLGLEGVMAKRIDSPYIPQRSDYWLKIKLLKTLDVVVCGWTSGRRNGFGSLIVGAYKNGKLVYLGKVGTGFSQEDVKLLVPILKKLEIKTCPFKTLPDLDLPPDRKAFWTKPKLVCEVRFQQLSPEGIMRAPAFLRLRNDKPPSDCQI